MTPSEIRAPFDRCCCLVIRDSELVDDNTFVTWPRMVGKSILCYGRRKSYFPFQCLVGPDWMIVVFVYMLIVSINVVILYISSPLGWPPILIGAVGAVVLLVCYTVTVCSDPGIVYKNDHGAVVENEALNQDVESQQAAMLHPNGRNGAVNPAGLMECGQCQFHRPTTARHCHYCGVCVDDLDHHCPWSGKCIGKRNIKAFYAFMHALCFQFYYLIGLLVYYLIYAMGNRGLPHGPSF